MRTFEKIAAASWRVVGVVGALFAVAWLVSQVAPVVVAIVIALMICGTLAPLEARLRGLGWNPSAASLAVTLSWIVLLLAVMAGLGLRLQEQLPELADRLSEGLQRLGALVPGLDLSGSASTADLLDRLRGVTGGDAVISGARTLGLIMGGTLLAIALSFFMLRDGSDLWDRFVALWPDEHQPTVDDVGRSAFGTLSRYVRGLTVVALADGVLTGLGLLLLGVPLALTLGVLTFVSAYIPSVGALAVGALAVAVGLAHGGPPTAAAVLALYVGVQQVDSNILQPHVMGSRLPLHPSAVLIALVAGGLLAGIAGALLAVPLAAATVAAFETYRRDVHEDTPPAEVGAAADAVVAR